MACIVARVLESSELQSEVTVGIGVETRAEDDVQPPLNHFALRLAGLTALTCDKSRTVAAMASLCAGAAANMLRSTRTTVASSSRALFSSSTRRLAEPAAPAASESPDSPIDGATPAIEEAPAATAPISSGQKNGYRAWLSGEGSRYRRPLPGKPNWIGDTVSTH